jgi:hypothetical protein
MHFLVVDNRFGVPIFVFLERDPSSVEGSPGVRGRWVTLDPVEIPVSKTGRAHPGFAGTAAIGADPGRRDRFAEFPTDRDVRDAGYALIEPRYVGPSWETYLSVFHPEGGKRTAPSAARPRVIR